MQNDRIRVLFVDDEENNLKAFKATFRREMDVFVATGGNEALKMLETTPVHVIISDQRMPGMTGSMFLAIAKERYPKIMRMLLTGYTDIEAVVKAVNEGGIYAYATKPWDENDLKLRIQQAYEIHSLRTEKDNLLNRYGQVFESSGDPIVIVDHKGRMLEANNACSKLLGITRDKLLEGRFTDHMEEPEGLVRSLRKHRTGNEFVNVDITLRTATGNLIDCLMTATYLGNQQGRQDVFQAIIKDVTDRKQAENHLKKLNSDLDKRVAMRTSQLLEALEDLGSFSYSIAHDLRSPLKNIAAISDLLHTSVQDGTNRAECADYAVRINRGANHMIQLVDDLLRFSQTNTRELERKPNQLTQLAQDAMNDVVPEDRAGQVIVDVSPGTEVLTDAPMLKVVFHNLLSNALKFTRNRPDPLISIGHCREGDKDHIWVRDNGVGFEAKHKDQAFGVFKRLHKADQFEGTGVGLAIVHRIVNKHGGEVWAESAVGEGTTIHITLPTTLCRVDQTPFNKVA